MNRLTEVLKALELLAEAEIQVGAFYFACARVFPDEREFWRALSDAEVSHAQTIRKMAEMVEANPERYTAARPLDKTAVRVFIEGLKRNTVRVDRREFDLGRALKVARDTEYAVLEKKLGEIVETDDTEFASLYKVVNDQTDLHLASIERKIMETKSHSRAIRSFP